MGEGRACASCVGACCTMLSPRQGLAWVFIFALGMVVGNFSATNTKSATSWLRKSSLINEVSFSSFLNMATSSETNNQTPTLPTAAVNASTTQNQSLTKQMPSPEPQVTLEEVQRNSSQGSQLLHVDGEFLKLAPDQRGKGPLDLPSTLKCDPLEHLLVINLEGT
eukprot:Skav222789  [mRNA]  locus=scaffold1419:3712:7315:+ [translate_table: standard]